MNIELRDIRDWSQIEPLCSRLSAELGEGVIASMRCWCGLDERPYPLKNWHVRFASVGTQLIGITGCYQEPSEPPRIGWLGWLGIAQERQRQGLGTFLLKYAEKKLISFGVEEVFVHTSRMNEKGAHFYEKNGYQRGIEFSKLGLRQRSSNSDSIVFNKSIANL